MILPWSCNSAAAGLTEARAAVRADDPELARNAAALDHLIVEPADEPPFGVGSDSGVGSTREPMTSGSGPTRVMRRTARCLTFAVLTVACAGAPPRFTTSTLSVSSTVSPTNEMVSIALGELRPWQSPLDVAVGADAVWVTVHDLGLV
jgi:hypothetical protein